MSSAIQQEDRFADVGESRFQAAKRSNMSSPILLQDRIAEVQESRFSVRNVQIWVVLSSN